MSSVDDETIMNVLTESDAPRLTTTEVAEELPLARGTVRSRLQALVDEGRLEREREGRDVVWFLPDRGDEPAPEAETDAVADAGDGQETDEGPDAVETGEAVSDEEDEHGHEQDGEPADGEEDEDEDEDEDERAEGVADEPTDEAADAETAPITERGEMVAADPDPGSETDSETERPATSEVAGGPLDRMDRDRLVRAATAAALLAVIYAVFRRIRGGP